MSSWEIRSLIEIKDMVIVMSQARALSDIVPNCRKSGASP